MARCFRLSLLTLVCYLWTAGPASFAQEHPPQPPRSPHSGSDATPDALLKQVREAIELSSRRYLSAERHTPWQIMHGLLAYRQGYPIKHSGEIVSALDWIASGPTHNGIPWFHKTPYGAEPGPYTEAYDFQGHPDQFLAIFAMADLPPDFEFQSPDGPVTIRDLVRHAQYQATGQKEVAWTLWALSHYLEPDSRWQNAYGQTWSVERLVAGQLREPTSSGACGGTHGLFALSYARNVRVRAGLALEGVWQDAERHVTRYVEQARQYQNSDGSFSADFFDRSSYTDQLQDRLYSSGHTLEFVMMALPDERLTEPWVRDAVTAVARDLLASRREPLECSALYHAVHGLVLYEQRIVPLQDSVAELKGLTNKTRRDDPIPSASTQ